MNRRIIILSLAAAFAAAILFTIFALTTTTISAFPGNARATGGGTAEENGGKSTFVFNAVQQKNGSVNGHLVYQFRSGDIGIKMDIDCLVVSNDGHGAIMSGVIRQVNGDAASFPWITVGNRGEFQVRDNGEGGGAPPDLFSDLIIFPGASCNPNNAPAAYIPVSGNIQVQP
jgi:hypothetical protein